MSSNRVTVVDIQHKTFKRALQGYERTEVDQFLDEVIETLEDEATARAALEAEIADLKERISHFKAMEESLQSTLLLAQRTADEVKAAAHKEADLIKQEARLKSEREVSSLGERVEDARREHQRMIDIAETAKSEIRSLLHSHLALIDRPSANGTPASIIVRPAAGGVTPAAVVPPVAPLPPDDAPPVVKPSAVTVPAGASTVRVEVASSLIDDIPPMPRNGRIDVG